MKLFKKIKQLFCPHHNWNGDKQIRTIECIRCGKRAWIQDYVHLYDKPEEIEEFFAEAPIKKTIRLRARIRKVFKV